jgi:hypothetical protein
VKCTGYSLGTVCWCLVLIDAGTIPAFGRHRVLRT